MPEINLSDTKKRTVVLLAELKETGKVAQVLAQLLC